MKRLLVVLVLFGLISPFAANAGHGVSVMPRPHGDDDNGAGLSDDEGASASSSVHQQLTNPAHYFVEFKCLKDIDRDQAINALVFPIADATQAILEQKVADKELSEDNCRLATEIGELLDYRVFSKVSDLQDDLKLRSNGSYAPSVDLATIRARGVFGCTYILGALITPVWPTEQFWMREAQLKKAKKCLKYAFSWEGNEELKGRYRCIFDLLGHSQRISARRR